MKEEAIIGGGGSSPKMEKTFKFMMNMFFFNTTQRGGVGPTIPF